jgi:S-adenosylmethionine:tRNA ribosyltransferase-isomerase
MRPATRPRDEPGSERLLYVDPMAGRFFHRVLGDLASLVRSGDLLVVNDAATLPASLFVSGQPLEVRLVRRGQSDADWTAILLGAGDFRTPTEKRAPPRAVREGERLDFGDELSATVVAVDAESPLLVDIRFQLQGAALLSALYRRGRPIQYAYLERELPLWEFQNRFAARPWALELASAAHGLTWDMLFRLRARGVAITHLTHAAGISSTGSAALDRRLPFPERYEISAATRRAVARTKNEGGRIIAVGTTVVRALEACHAEHGELRAGEGEARLVIGPGFRPSVVDGILSGMHEPKTSHHALLQAFARRELLDRAFEAAEQAGYLEHEFGDTMLILET